MAQNLETVLILDPDLAETSVQTNLEQVSKLITDRGGNILKTQVWGKRRLEYAIQKKKYAIYAILYFEMDKTGDLVPELERLVRVSDELLREMTVKVPAFKPVDAPSDVPFTETVRQRRPASRGRRPAPPSAPSPAPAPAAAAAPTEDKAEKSEAETSEAAPASAPATENAEAKS